MAKQRIFVSTLLLLLIIQSIFPCLRSDNPRGICIQSERAALLDFKADLTDRRNILSSWEGEDCCRWWGVECNNKTGHVLTLNLRSTNNDIFSRSWTGDLAGEINPSLLHLKHLRRLDLSLNNFTGAPIPEFFGSFGHLRYLNLSGAGFIGQIPPQLGNLSRLRYLDFYGNFFDDGNLYTYLHTDNLGWVQRLSSLKHLDMSGVNLTVARDWLYMVNMLPSLTFLKLMGCGLDFIPSYFPYVNFTSLITLDLSDNNFNVTMPQWFFNISSLTNMNLDFNGFYGPIPDAISNLTSLVVLNLGRNKFDGTIPSFRNLCSLNYLRLSFNNLSEAIDELMDKLPNCTERRLQTLSLRSNRFSGKWTRGLEQLVNLNTLYLSDNLLNGSIPAEIGKLLQLTSLVLSRNQLDGPLPAEIGKLLQLTSLHLSDNQLDGPVPAEIGKLLQLTYLDLSYNQLDGPVPAEIGKLLWLTSLDLSDNQLDGPLPAEIGKLLRLTSLDLSDNQLHGPLPAEIGKLLQLTRLDLGNNFFEGVITEAHFANLTRLKYLILSNNFLTISVHESWVPPFQPISIGMGSCLVGPGFPAWLQHQKEISDLDLSSSGISDTVPGWFWKNITPLIEHLDLSNNSIGGQLPESLEFAQGSGIFLSSNRFEGSLSPTLPYNTDFLDLSRNSFSGPLPSIESPNLYFLDLSDNHFNSNIPSSWREVRYLSYLDLSDNNFSGEFPNEWPEFVLFINLDNNHLSGRIPSSLGSLTQLIVLGLSNNSLSGLFPASLQNCTDLSFLDLGHNKFYGIIPTWLGESFPSLKVLLLRSNMFSGSIPPQLMQLHDLQILDLAENNLSGPIPRRLGNLTAMASITKKDPGLADYVEYVIKYYISASVFTKGEELEYTKNRYLVRSIDLSNNHLIGEIPEEIGALTGLINLNLSANYLQGKITEKIGRLKALESLDLSRNKLSGNIPLSISSLYSLSYLNLSYNHLSGRIPSGNQLQTLNNASIYEGNIDLCGPPLSKNCSSNKTNEDRDGVYDHDAGDETLWLYLGMWHGYVMGFLTVCGVLLFKKKWRYAYFRFFDNMYDRLYVAVSLAKARRERMEGN